MFNINKLKIAILFSEEYDEKKDFVYYLADRVLLGTEETFDNGNTLFTDYFTGIKYQNIAFAYEMEVPEGYEMVFSLNDFIKMIRPNKTLGDIIKSYWLERENLVYFFDANTGYLVGAKPEEMLKIGIDAPLLSTNNINALNEAIAGGDIEKINEIQEVITKGKKIVETLDNKVEKVLMKPISETINNIKKSIINQDEAIKKMVVAIYKNLIFDDITMKSSILMYGPTGVGKTALVKELAKVFDVPVWIEDVTRYTDTGYKGANTDDILVNLYNNANQDIERAERSILFLDEIDKKASKGEDRDFNKGDVLKNLLKIVEGGVFEVEYGHADTLKFDTSKLTVIVGGAFTDLYNLKEEVKKTNSIGFGSEQKEIVKTSNKNIEIKDFEKYGMPLEFLGRFKTIIRMNSLSKDDFITILKTSNLSSLKNYIKTFESKGISLELPDNIYDKIATKAFSYGTGARSINIVVDNIFEDILYELFNDMDSIEEISLKEDIVDNNKNYVLKRKLVK